MRAIAAAHGFGGVIVPLRPVLKDRYPLTPIERYIRWQRPDQSPFDPWIRVHTGLGGSILKAAPRSLKITGSVSEWESWTQMAFPETDNYVIPQGLSTVSITVPSRSRCKGPVGLMGSVLAGMRRPPVDTAADIDAGAGVTIEGLGVCPGTLAGPYRAVARTTAAATSSRLGGAGGAPSRTAVGEPLRGPASRSESGC